LSNPGPRFRSALVMTISRAGWFSRALGKHFHIAAARCTLYSPSALGRLLSSVRRSFALAPRRVETVSGELLIDTNVPCRRALMANRRRNALAAAVSMFCLLPIASHAGGGAGIPAAPGAGKSTDYCCLGTPQRVTQGNGANAFTFINATMCTALDETDTLSRNNCPGTVVKCRGEFFTPTSQVKSQPPGQVQRCLTP